MILGLYLFFSFAAITFIRKDLHAARDLFLFGAINAAITILPPLGSKVYQLLFLFYEKREFISLVIGEWVPMENPPEISVRSNADGEVSIDGDLFKLIPHDPPGAG